MTEISEWNYRLIFGNSQDMEELDTEREYAETGEQTVFMNKLVMLLAFI